MNLLIVTQYFFPENFRINDLVEGMVARGHRVTVLTGLPNYPAGRWFDGYGLRRGPWRETLLGATVVRVPILARGRSSGWRLALNYLSFALGASVIGAVRVRGPFDAIFVFEPSPVTVGLPAIASRLLHRAPILLWVLDLWPESVIATGGVRSRWMLGSIATLTRWIYTRCDLVLVQSRAFFAPLETQGVPGARLRYFPNWAESMYRRPTLETETDPAASQPESSPITQSALPALPPGFKVLFAGNIGVAQDFPTLIAAAELLRDRLDIQWLIAGDGRMRGWVEQQISTRGLAPTVHLLGALPLAAMPALFARVDALLVTLRDEPIFALTIPGKIQSYLASGMPVIAALRGEGAEVIRRAGAGVICAPEDPAGLADAVLRLNGISPEARSALGRSARTCYEEEFERERAFDRLEGWIAELRKSD